MEVLTFSHKLFIVEDKSYFIDYILDSRVNTFIDDYMSKFLQV